MLNDNFWVEPAPANVISFFQEKHHLGTINMPIFASIPRPFLRKYYTDLSWSFSSISNLSAKLTALTYTDWNCSSAFSFMFLIRRCAEAVAQRCSVKKVFLEISQNSQENTCARISFWHRCFPVNFVRFLRTRISIKHLWLLLYLLNLPYPKMYFR